MKADSGGDFRKTMGNLEHVYEVSAESPVCKGEWSKLLEHFFVRNMQTIFMRFGTFFLYLCVADRMEWVA